EATDFNLEIDKLNADAHEQAGQKVVDPDGKAHDVVEFGRVGPTESGDVLFGHHGVVQRIVLVAEFDDRAGQAGAGLKTKTLGKRAGGIVAHDDLERNDLDFLDQLLAHVDAAQEVGRNAQIVQLGEDEFGNAVVQ